MSCNILKRKEEDDMKKLGKKAGSAYETFSAYACICNCSSCSGCSCNAVLQTRTYYNVLNGSNTSRTSSRNA